MQYPSHVFLKFSSIDEWLLKPQKTRWPQGLPCGDRPGLSPISSSTSGGIESQSRVSVEAMIYRTNGLEE